MVLPLVSVCVTTYNHERYIRSCLDSVLMQNGSISLELLVGDDLSNDGTEHIIREIAVRHPDVVRYIRHTEKKGAAENLAFLVREARGEYIAHLDGDDFWLPGKLTSQLAFLKAHPDYPAVYTNAFCIWDDGAPAGIFTNHAPEQLSISELIRRGNFLNHGSILYRAELKCHILDPGSNLLDYNIHLQLARHGALGYLKTPMTVYRITSSSSILVHTNDYVRELYWAALCSDMPPCVSPADLSAGMAEFMRSIFFRSIRTRSPRLVFAWWPRVLKKAPLGKGRLIIQACLSIFRVGGREVISLLCRQILGNTMKVLYPK